MAGGEMNFALSWLYVEQYEFFVIYPYSFTLLKYLLRVWKGHSVIQGNKDSRKRKHKQNTDELCKLRDHTKCVRDSFVWNRNGETDESQKKISEWVVKE
jgi:hypothetical protein